jgi:hypothetical protein
VLVVEGDDDIDGVNVEMLMLLMGMGKLCHRVFRRVVSKIMIVLEVFGVERW